MPGELPVPVTFRLGEGWVVDHNTEGRDVAFAARRPSVGAVFTPVITIDGRVLEGGSNVSRSLAAVADESRDRLDEVHGDARVVARCAVGRGRAPGLVQTLALRVRAPDGSYLDLVQDQVHTLFLGALDPSRGALVSVVLTVTRAQHPEVLPDFQAFVGTVELDRS